MDKNVKTTKISKSYAQALIELGQSQTPDYEKIFEDLNTIKSSMTNELSEVLTSPTIQLDKKIQIFKDIFEDKIDKHVLEFFILLINKSRFNEFENILYTYSKELDEKNNIKTIAITSAVELDESEKSEIIDKLQNKLHKNVKPLWKISETVIAGLVVKIDDDVIDLSVDTKLKSLSKNIR